MARLTEKKFTLLFMVLLILELICGTVPSLSQWHYITKPSLLTALILYFSYHGKTLPAPIRNMTLLALVFSLLGDIFLMFVMQSAKYFILGLACFFLAHVFYSLVFFKNRNPKTKPYGLVFILLLYAFAFFYLLKNHLGDLLIPVLLYMVIILIMATMAFLRYKKVSHKSFILVFIGAILFVISDSILALNKFYMPLKYTSISIMLTYGLAQFFIVKGLLKHQ